MNVYSLISFLYTNTDNWLLKEINEQSRKERKLNNMVFSGYVLKLWNNANIIYRNSVSRRLVDIVIKRVKKRRIVANLIKPEFILIICYETMLQYDCRCSPRKIRVTFPQKSIYILVFLFLLFIFYYIF